VLVAGHANVAAMYLGDLAHAFAAVLRIIIQQTAGMDLQRQMPLAVVALDPAKTIAIVIEVIRPRWLQLERQSRLQLVAIPRQAAIIDGVFEPRMQPLAAVAVLALQANRLPAGFKQLVGGNETDQIAQRRIGGR